MPASEPSIAGFRPLTRLAQDQEPGRAGGEAGGGRGLGAGEVALEAECVSWVAYRVS